MKTKRTQRQVTIERVATLLHEAIAESLRRGRRDPSRLPIVRGDVQEYLLMCERLFGRDNIPHREFEFEFYQLMGDKKRSVNAMKRLCTLHRKLIEVLKRKTRLASDDPVVVTEVRCARKDVKRFREFDPQAAAVEAQKLERLLEEYGFGL